MNRRRVILGLCATAVGLGFKDRLIPTAAGGLPEESGPDFASLEEKAGGRLGVATLDTRTGARFGHRPDERFPLCSTFKLLAAGAVLGRVDAGEERLERNVRFQKSDLVDYSPVTKARAGARGMSVGELCEAAITRSDNTAGNLLLASLGGPQGLNAFLRSLRDTVTRLDRIEPDLNEGLPGDPRDTTTPAAMLSNLHSLTLGTALSDASRAWLTGWLVRNQTGGTRLRAGVPAGWRVGDKTGSGQRGSTNDVGLLWPPQRPPVLVAAYLTGTSAAPAERDAALAGVGRAVVAAVWS